MSLLPLTELVAVHTHLARKRLPLHMVPPMDYQLVPVLERFAAHFAVLTLHVPASCTVLDLAQFRAWGWRHHCGIRFLVQINRRRLRRCCRCHSRMSRRWSGMTRRRSHLAIDQDRRHSSDIVHRRSCTGGRGMVMQWRSMQGRRMRHYGMQGQMVAGRVVVIGQFPEHFVVQELTQVDVDLGGGRGRGGLIKAGRRKDNSNELTLYISPPS